MKLPDLIDLSLILMLAPHSKGQEWKISVDRHIKTKVGSNVTIKCNFTIPPKYATENPKVYWKKKVKSTFDTKDKDKYAYIYHTNATFELEKYRGKTNLIGDIKNGDCTLEITQIMDSDKDIYVRVIAKGDQYSFIKNSTTIFVEGHLPNTPIPDNSNSASPTFESSTVEMTEMPLPTTTTIYVAIFVPVAALLLIILVTGIVLWKKHRSKSITREDSGYYANFRRASSNQAKRDASCKKQDTGKLPESKVIDEPVYINLEVPPGQSNDHTDSVYANVDYLKR